MTTTLPRNCIWILDDFKKWLSKFRRNKILQMKTRINGSQDNIAPLNLDTQMRFILVRRDESKEGRGDKWKKKRR